VVTVPVEVVVLLHAVRMAPAESVKQRTRKQKQEERLFGMFMKVWFLVCIRAMKAFANLRNV
jgi:hypothetical protein